MKILQSTSIHLLDVNVTDDASVSLVVEELPDTILMASDCASSAASVSTLSSLGCGSFSSAGSLSSMGSVASSGG